MIEPNPNFDKVLERTSKILSKSFNEKEDLLDSTNVKNNEITSFNHNDNLEKKRKSKHTSEIGLENDIDDFKPKSILTPFLLLIALSLHGFFEGIALGIQMEMNGVLFLATAIISHKWAEAFTLVIYLYLIYLFNFF